MRGVVNGLLVLLAGALIAAGEEPPTTDTPPGPAPAPTPAPVAPAVPAPPLIAIPPSASGIPRPDQPAFGPWTPPSPAQDLAMLEAEQPVFANDLRVASAAALLSQLTAVYVEDAPRIAELTIRLVRDIRAAKQAASPVEVLVGATQWKRPANTRGDVPRKFEQFAGLYRKWRIEGGRDHTTALSLMQASRPPQAPGP